MTDLLNWLVLLASVAAMTVFAGFVLKGYYLLFMLGWGVI